MLKLQELFPSSVFNVSNYLSLCFHDASGPEGK